MLIRMDNVRAQGPSGVLFSDLGLSPKVFDSVVSCGFEVPTPIQAQAIPKILERRDILGLAQTGSGKTAAFALPMLSLLEKGRARARMPRTLILEPTRELALQVQEAFERFGQAHNLTIALLMGGVSFGDQSTRLDRGVDVVIATPGRLLDHMERGKLLPLGIEIFVVDEADRMMDMGFIPDLERIFKALPPSRQTLFFSATMAPEIERLTSQFLKDPVRVEVSAPSATAETIVQKILPVASSADYDKRKALRALLMTYENIKNAIIFSNRKSTVGILERSMQRHGFEAVALHGDMDQRARLGALEAFRSGKSRYLIASDVAARGLDIPQVSHVFNYDVPVNPEDYVHRIGRTGRAGREGHAFTLVTPVDHKAFVELETFLKVKLEVISLEAISPAEGMEGLVQLEGREKASSGRRGKGRRSESKKDTSAPMSRSRREKEKGKVSQREEQPEKTKKKARLSPQSHAQSEVLSLEDDPMGFTSGNTPAFLLRTVAISSKKAGG